MSVAKTTRWLDLLAFLLQHRFAVTREQIFARVPSYGFPDPTDKRKTDSARRTFERDKDELRDLGVEIESVDLPAEAGTAASSGYRLRPRGLYLPYFELERSDREGPPYPSLPRFSLSAAELEVLDAATRRLAQQDELPLADALRSARRKIGFDLPLEPDDLEQALALPLPEESQRALAVVQDAVAGSRAVRIGHYAIERDEEEERTIEPYALVFHWSCWYCVAARVREPRDPSRLEVLEVHRITRAEMLGPETRFERPAGFDVRNYIGKPPWALGDAPAVQARVRFEFPESRWVINRQVGRTVEEWADRSAVIELLVRDRDSFLRWVLSFGRRARLLAPPELVLELEGLRRKVAAIYSSGGDRAE